MKKYFNIEYAIIGFVSMSIPTIFLNLIEGTLFEALRAGFVQGSLTFFIVGLNTTLFEYLNRKSEILGILIPVLFTSGLSFIIHTVNNSPQPLLTAGFVVLTSSWNFSILTYFEEKYKTIEVKELYHKLKKYLKSTRT